MPYYQRSWNSVIDGKAGAKKVVDKKKLRYNPANETLTGEQERKLNTNIQAIQINFLRGLLKKHVTDLCCRIEAAQPIEKYQEKFANYEINYKKTFFKGQFSSMYETFNYKLTDNTLFCRIFEPTALIDPVKEVYLKILRQIGKKHACIIATWDIFYDQQNKIFLFQEFANIGNGIEYMKRERVVEEIQLLRWAQSIYRGLEFLGDIGIAHRSINPKHILFKLVQGNADIQVKLSGFRSAIIYWDAVANDVIDQPCRSMAENNFANFQAPEVFGNHGEFFNPIDADIWSFGATMFYFVARVYPYNVLVTPPAGIDDEIKTTIDAMAAKFSKEARNWLYGLLRANVKHRFDFDDIKRQPWFKGGGAKSASSRSSSVSKPPDSQSPNDRVPTPTPAVAPSTSVRVAESPASAIQATAATAPEAASPVTTASATKTSTVAPVTELPAHATAAVVPETPGPAASHAPTTAPTVAPVTEPPAPDAQASPAAAPAPAPATPDPASKAADDAAAAASQTATEPPSASQTSTEQELQTFKSAGNA